MLILLSLLACDSRTETFTCDPGGAPMAFQDPGVLLELWVDELSLEGLDHETIANRQELAAQLAIRATLEAGGERCISLRSSPSGFEIDAGEGCVEGDGSRWAGRIQYEVFEDFERLTYEDFSFADDPEADAFAFFAQPMNFAWDGEVLIFSRRTEVRVVGHRAGLHPAVPARETLGISGRLELIVDDEAGEELYFVELDENPRDPQATGGLCMHSSEIPQDRLRLHAWGAQDTLMFLDEGCTSGVVDEEPFEGVCL